MTLSYGRRRALCIPDLPCSKFSSCCVHQYGRRLLLLCTEAQFYISLPFVFGLRSFSSVCLSSNAALLETSSTGTVFRFELDLQWQSCSVPVRWQLTAAKSTNYGNGRNATSGLFQRQTSGNRPRCQLCVLGSPEVPSILCCRMGGGARWSSHIQRRRIMHWRSLAGPFPGLPRTHPTPTVTPHWFHFHRRPL